MQIRTCLTNNRICVSIIHCDFDGYFYRKKCVLYTGKYGTVEPCYLELKPISLGFALLFSVIFYWLSQTQLSQTPYLKQRAASLVPVLQTNLPHYLKLPAVWANCCFPREFKTSWVLHCTVASFCVTQEQTFPTILYSRIVLANYNVFCTYFFNYKVIFIFLKFALWSRNSSVCLFSTANVDNRYW